MKNCCGCSKERRRDENRVIPKTIGQYTGLKDKNGREVFEGNIVEYNGYMGELVKGEIVFHRCEFVIKLSEKFFSHLSRLYDRVTVIGNIHDNPEFLEASNE